MFRCAPVFCSMTESLSTVFFAVLRLWFLDEGEVVGVRWAAVVEGVQHCNRTDRTPALRTLSPAQYPLMACRLPPLRNRSRACSTPLAPYRYCTPPTKQHCRYTGMDRHSRHVRSVFTLNVYISCDLKSLLITLSTLVTCLVFFLYCSFDCITVQS